MFIHKWSYWKRVRFKLLFGAYFQRPLNKRWYLENLTIIRCLYWILTRRNVAYSPSLQSASQMLFSTWWYFCYFAQRLYNLKDLSFERLDNLTKHKHSQIEHFVFCFSFHPLNSVVFITAKFVYTCDKYWNNLKGSFFSLFDDDKL